MKGKKKEDKVFSILAAVWIVVVSVTIVRLFLGYNNTDIEVNTKEDKQRLKVVELEKKYNTDENIDKEYLNKIVDLCKDYPDATPILERYKEYPNRLLKLAISNKEAIKYVAEYPEKKDTYVQDIDISSECKQGEVPLFIQWDSRWGYKEYAGGLVGYTACGPTCLSMLYTYFTEDYSYTPGEMAEFSEREGYVEQGMGTKWLLMTEGANKLGLTSKVIRKKEENVANQIKFGKKIICSVGPGYFTEQGHFIVITDYNNGSVKINDPNSRKKSSRMWNYADISSQIKSMWAIGK